MIFVPLEYALPLRGVKLFDRSRKLDWLHALVTPLLTAALLAGLGATLGAFLRAHAPTPIHVFVAKLPFAASFALSVLLAEVGAYAVHYAMHRIPFLWRFHAIHHAPEQLDFLAGMRRHPVDTVLSVGAVSLPAYVLGFPLANVAAFAIVFQLWTIFVHADVAIRLGPLERVISSPFFHHGHHDRSETAPKNLASLLSFLDVIFGTYQKRETWPAAYGTNDRISKSWLGQIFVCADRSEAAFPVDATRPPGSPENARG